MALVIARVVKTHISARLSAAKMSFDFMIVRMRLVEVASPHDVNERAHLSMGSWSYRVSAKEKRPGFNAQYPTLKADEISAWSCRCLPASPGSLISHTENRDGLSQY